MISFKLIVNKGLCPFFNYPIIKNILNRKKPENVRKLRRRNIWHKNSKIRIINFRINIYVHILEFQSRPVIIYLRDMESFILKNNSEIKK